MFRKPREEIVILLDLNRKPMEEFLKRMEEIPKQIAQIAKKMAQIARLGAQITVELAQVAGNRAQLRRLNSEIGFQMARPDVLRARFGVRWERNAGLIPRSDRSRGAKSWQRVC